jgi:Helix-hairpin-helix motif
MSSMPGPIPVDQGDDLGSRCAGMPWIWPARARGVLAAVVIMSALALAIASRSVPAPGAEIVKAPDLLLDLNTVPPSVLETLPHVGQSLIRQIVAARERRPIASLDDAGSRIRGLGPSTLAQIAPYLRFEQPARPSLADSGNAAVEPRTAKPRSTGRKTTRSRKPKLASIEPRLVSRSAEPGPL